LLESDQHRQADPLNDAFFRTDLLASTLRSRSIRGGAIAVTAQAIKTTLHVGSVMVLARLLAPADFGLIAMVMVLTGLVRRFKDLGLAMSTVQKEDINHGQISTLFWVNVSFGGMMTMLTVGAGPVLAWFYRDPRLTHVAWALSGAFLISGLSAQHLALLRRQMRFAAIAAIELVSVFVGLAAGVVLAMYGWGYWSLVVQQLGIAVVSMMGAWIGCGWRPGRPVRGSGVRSMLAFGGNLTGVNLLNYLMRNVDKALIGWRFGSVSLGLYSKAYEMLMLPIQQINTPLTAVAIPTLSRLQSKPDSFRSSFLRAITLLVFVAMPVAVFIVVVAEPLVLTVLGDQWVDTIPMFRALGPAAIISTFGVATGWVFISLGQTGRQLRLVSVSVVVSVVGMAVGLHWGPVGVAAGLSVAMCVVRLPGIVYCYRASPLRVRDLIGVIWRPAVASAVAGWATYVATVWLASRVGATWTLGADVLLFGGSYLATLAVLPGGRGVLGEVMTVVRELTSTKSDEPLTAESADKVERVPRSNR